MIWIRAAFCRLVPMGFPLALPVLPHREPAVLSSCAELGRTLREKGVRRALIVTDPSILSCGLVKPLEAALGESGIGFSYMRKPSPIRPCTT